MYIFLAVYTFRASFFTKAKTKYVQNRIQSLPDLEDVAPLQKVDDQSTKYILLWTVDNPENPIGEGHEPFKRYNCLHQNCHITTNKNLLHDYTDFHAIVLNSSYLKRWKKSDLPQRRSQAQKYIFFSTNSSEESIICNAQADNFFNWTWTYKLYSDIFNPFFEVRNLKGDVVAPSFKVVWEKYVDEDIDLMAINKTTKSKAMAVIWKNCKSTNVQLQFKIFVAMMKPYLEKESLQFDVFGCEHKKYTCDKNCLKNITDNYYFYWVHEISVSEDYVTDELMNAIETNTIPVVYGLADYSRFLPPGSYIKLEEIAPQDLALTLIYVIQNLDVYLSYFRWKKYYTFHRTPMYHGLCQLCSNLNNPFMMEKHSHYKMFRRWWYPGPFEKRCMKRVKDHDAVWPIWKKSWQNKSREFIMKEQEKLFDMVM
ncbi:glycosyltransferase family 10 (fucosyltransferase) c-term domain-containing protein [Phthorimaea operculella]|nr:glycosyltransferase family 10 (fucosyltransferase) c-term domain-containing protein [Phthorimaea operculella]